MRPSRGSRFSSLYSYSEISFGGKVDGNSEVVSFCAVHEVCSGHYCVGEEAEDEVVLLRETFIRGWPG